MTDEVDAAVEHVEAAGAEAMPDLVASDAGRKELPARYDPVLTAGKCGNGPVTRMTVGLS